MARRKLFSHSEPKAVEGNQPKGAVQEEHASVESVQKGNESKNKSEQHPKFDKFKTKEEK